MGASRWWSGGRGGGLHFLTAFQTGPLECLFSAWSACRALSYGRCQYPTGVFMSKKRTDRPTDRRHCGHRPVTLAVAAPSRRRVLRFPPTTVLFIISSGVCFQLRQIYYYLLFFPDRFRPNNYNYISYTWTPPHRLAISILFLVLFF